MKICLFGVTGFIGQALVHDLLSQNHELVVFSRNPSSAPFTATTPNLQLLRWSGGSLDQDYISTIDGCDAIVNLSGEGIANRRWSHSQKRKIIDSRINSCSAILDAIRKCVTKPGVVISASAVGYYGDVPEGEVTESHPSGVGFLAETCIRWEESLNDVSKLGVRLVVLRIGVVLERGGGALAKILPPFRFFIGGPLGTGKQWFPWIHRDDVLRIIAYALVNPSLNGPINVASPNPLRLKEFCKILGKVLNRPSWAPVPAFVLRLLLGEMSDLLLTGQRIIPSKLDRAGFSFKHETAESALLDIIERK